MSYPTNKCIDVSICHTCLSVTYENSCFEEVWRVEGSEGIIIHLTVPFASETGRHQVRLSVTSVHGLLGKFKTFRVYFIRPQILSVV